MKKEFAKTLVGGAVLAACGLANAATSTYSPSASSIEANTAAVAANASASLSLGNITISLAGTGYADGDVVTFTLTGAQLRTSSVGAVDDEVYCQGRYLNAAGNAPNATSVTATGSDRFGVADATLYDALKLKITEVSTNSVKFVVTRLNNNVSIGSRTYTDAAGATQTLAATTCVLRKGTTSTATPWEVLQSSLTSPSTVRFNWSAASSGGTVHDFLTDVNGNPAQSKVAHYSFTQYGVYAAGPDTTKVIHPSSLTNSAFVTYPAQTHFQDQCNGSGAQINRQSLTQAAGGSSGTAYAPSSLCNSNKGSGYGGGDLAAEFGVVLTDNFSAAALGYSAGNREAKVTNVVISYRGNFNFLDNDNNGCTLSDLSSGWARLGANTILRSTAQTASARPISSFTQSSIVAIASDCSEIQASVPMTAGTDAYHYLRVTVGVNASELGAANGAKPLPAGSITAVATFRQDTTVLGTGSATVSTWTLDSQSANINYMPYGTGISRIVYVTSAASSPVTISAVNEAGTSCASTNFPAVSVVASRPTSLSSAMDAGVATCYGSSYTGKVRFTVTLASAVSRGQYTLRLSNQTITPYKAAAAPTTYAGNVAYTATSSRTAADHFNTNDAQVAEIAPQSGTISRIADTFEIYSAYNVNGNRVQVTNETNGR